MIVYNVLTQQYDSSTTTADTAQSWRDSLELSFDVLADPDGEWQFYWGGAAGTSQHSYTVVDSDGLVYWRVDDGRAAPLNDITGAAAAFAAQ